MNRPAREPSSTVSAAALLSLALLSPALLSPALLSLALLSLALLSLFPGLRLLRLALLSALGRIKRERDRRGLTLADVAEASGLDKGMLSRLENGKLLNLTMLTLCRYARAVGVELRLETHVTTAGAEA